MSKITSDDIATVIHSIIGKTEKESLEAMESLMSSEAFLAVREEIQKGDYERFYFDLKYPIEKLFLAFVKSSLPDIPEARFLMNESSFVQKQIRSLITQCEGTSCCADKTRTVMKALVRFYLTGEKTDFNYNQEYTYHLPSTVLKSHEDRVAFFDGVWRMHCGDPLPFMAAYTKEASKVVAVNDTSPGL